MGFNKEETKPSPNLASQQPAWDSFRHSTWGPCRSLSVGGNPAGGKQEGGEQGAGGEHEGQRERVHGGTK